MSEVSSHIIGALSAMNRGLSEMSATQRLHTEMLGKILAAVTKEADGGLAKLLERLVAASDMQTLLMQDIHMALVPDIIRIPHKC